MPAAAPSGRDADALRSLARRIDPSDPGAQNNLGVFYYERGMIPEAIAAFGRALELDPEMRVAQDNLETLQRESGYYDTRIGELHEQLAREPGARATRLELARAYLALGQHDQAALQYEDLLRTRPTDATALVQLGIVEQSRGRLEIATEWFRRACEVDPGSSVARLYLGRALYNRGLNDKALSVLTEASVLAPDHAEVHYVLGFVYGDLGHHEAARAATRKAIALNAALGTAQPNLLIGGKRGSAPRRPAGSSAAGAAGAPPAALQAHLSLAVAFRKRGYLTEAFREYRLALEAGEDEVTALEGMAETHLLRKEFGAAIDLYDRLLQRQPGNPEFWNERGVCLHQAGRREEARGSYRRAVDADPSYALAWNNLGVAAAAESGTEAAEAFHFAIKARPDFTGARLNLALLHLQRHELKPALETYRAVLAERPADSVAWNGVGLVLMELHRHADARNAFARAVEGDPNSASARYNLGFALSQIGAFDDALRETRRALELDPFYVPQHFALAIQLQFEESLLPVPPSLAAAPGAQPAGEGFAFDARLLDDLFGELIREEPPPPSPGPRDDPFAVARDLLGKGLLDTAVAEVHRALRRGAPGSRGTALLGEIFAKRGLFGEALERFREAAALDPDDAEILLGEAGALVALGRGQEALGAADRAVALAPHRADTLVVRARARQLTGDLDGAAQDVVAAVGVAPGRADLLLLRGSVLRQLGDTDGALDAFTAALELDPSLVQAWYEKGLVEEELHRPVAARTAYQHAVELLPTFLDAGLALADLLRRTGFTAEAVRLLVDLLLAEPYAIEALVLLGRALAEDGRTSDAVAAFDRVLRFHAGHTVALFHRGLAQARLRRFGAAIADWERLIALGPTGPLAAAARAQVRSAEELAHILVRPTEA
jgi:tetratricopeptide (TPR) repeat protein